MQIRHAIAAVSVAAFALTLSACTSDPAPTGSDQPTSPAPSDTAQPESPSPTASSEPQPTAVVVIRPVNPGYSLESVSGSLRSGFPSYAEKSDEEIATILNAACDAMDAKHTPESAADAIQTYGIEPFDAAFSVSASIALYCPEYVEFLGRASTETS